MLIKSPGQQPISPKIVVIEQVRDLKNKLNNLMQECNYFGAYIELEKAIYTDFYKKMTIIIHRSCEYNFGEDVKRKILKDLDYRKKHRNIGL